MGHVPAGRGECHRAAADPGIADLRHRHRRDSAAVLAAGLLRPLRGDPARAGHRPAASPGGDRAARTVAEHVLREQAGLQQVTGAVSSVLDVHPRGVAAPAGELAVPGGLRQQHRGPVQEDPVPAVLRAVRLRGGVRVRVREPRVRGAAGRGLRGDRGGARRVPGAVPAGAGVVAAAVPVLHPGAHTRVAGAGVVVRPAVALLGRVCRLGGRSGGVHGPCVRVPGRRVDGAGGTGGVGTSPVPRPSALRPGPVSRSSRGKTWTTWREP